MSLTPSQKDWLQSTFGERYNDRRLERKLYSHDIGEMPRLVKPLLGKHLADAIVQPQSEEEIVKLVQWAAREKVNLVPRGMASSGYGGVLPVKGGVVVDFYRMRRIVTVDPQAMTVTTEPGITWEQVDKAINVEGLTLRTYPSSYPSSTVGGWLAQGGGGFGSYEAGWFIDNVVSARVVQGDGVVHELRADALEMLYEAEGITGIITQITFKVKPLERMEVLGFTFEQPTAMQRFIEGIIDADLPLWSLSFVNPGMVSLKNRAPLAEHGGVEEERVLLPERYIVTVVYRALDRRAVQPTLARLARESGGDLLAENLAHHEWDERFKIMSIKRLGPSLVPAEVVVPVEGLGKMLTTLSERIKQTIAMEGMIIRRGRNGTSEAIVLGFIPADQRSFAYNFIFGLSLTVLKTAEAFGGRPYATGLYFSKMADKVLGADKVRRLREYKRRVDPAGIFNPGKVLDGGLMPTFLKMAAGFEPLIRPFGNAVKVKLGERIPPKAVRGIPKELVWYAYACSQCGFCVQECDQFYGRGWESQSPRGKWFWLREYIEGREKWSQEQVDTFLACTTCEMCNYRCSEALPIEPSWMELRGKLIDEDKRMTIPPFEMMMASLDDNGNIWGAYRKDRSAWFPDDLKAKHGPEHKAKVAYFAGCTASYVENDIAQATVRLLDEAGVDFTYLGEKENCCALPALVAGKWDVFERVMRKNIEAMLEAGVETVTTSCPACDMVWRHVYPEWAEKLGIPYPIKAKHYTEVLEEQIAAGQFAFPENGAEKTKVTWHDSCHIGRASGVYEPPRALLQAIPNVELVEMAFNREEAHCCGGVITLISDPEIGKEVGTFRINEALETGAEKLVSLCPCCEFQFRVTRNKTDAPIEVVDLAHLASEALGYTFKNPDPEVQRQWQVFEGMIALMTPEGFARIMEQMWPELIDAMPYGMGSMMRKMAHIPGALEAMKPFFPVLFPIFLPKMMPKVMDKMNELVKEAIHMPDYMEEQMPDLMPRVIDNLMPHMLGDLVPLVTDPMIRYLKQEQGVA